MADALCLWCIQDKNRPLNAQLVADNLAVKGMPLSSRKLPTDPLPCCIKQAEQDKAPFNNWTCSQVPMKRRCQEDSGSEVFRLLG